MNFVKKMLRKKVPKNRKKIFQCWIVKGMIAQLFGGIRLFFTFFCVVCLPFYTRE